MNQDWQQSVEARLASFGASTVYHKPRAATRGVCMRLAAAAAEIHDVPLHQVLGDQRSRSVAAPRMEAMHLAVKLSGLSLPAIGRAFRRDHTTVLHAHRVTTQRAADDAAVVARLIDIARAAGFDIPEGTE
ncbi:helix-turn-helix domain-containing protein [Falsiroseomonas sp.]|uniref:helix-turn-helix domain-containing protein n=1 Tax=Falsiroseomonas sp. TaxID=2870721 RepID=UPI0027251893|nr:helix-turn-helix domain-containing protein [Falsiroseomonas sp.]MDO9499008.1 helix-turn-helix domain-containing protein [Falsiroseomonas sp.]